MKGVSLFHAGAIAIVGLVSAGPVGAQDTRAEIESEARSEKAQSSSSAAAPERGFFEQAFTWATKKLDGSKDGFYPELGGLIPGSGWLGIGPGYRRHLFGDAALVDASAAISSRRYSMMQSRIEWPKLASDHVSLGAQVRYQDFTEINCRRQSRRRLRSERAVADLLSHGHRSATERRRARRIGRASSVPGGREHDRRQGGT
jgi:hypothetical protein